MKRERVDDEKLQKGKRRKLKVVENQKRIKGVDQRKETTAFTSFLPKVSFLNHPMSYSPCFLLGPRTPMFLELESDR